MLTVEAWMDIKTLHRQGLSIRQIAAQTGRARNTVRRVVREARPPGPQRRRRTSCLDPYKAYLQEREAVGRFSAVRLLAELQPQGYAGSLDTVRRYLRHLRRDQRQRARATVRFETPPGEQAQVDWAHVGKFPLPAGGQLAVYAFVMVLGFSRQLYVECTSDMRLPTLLACHQRAFQFFAGLPRRILYDNMKQVRLGPGRWQPLFLDFCGHYGLVPSTHRPYRPRTKGKVERAIHYWRESFLPDREFTDLVDLNAQLQHWLATVANVRVHATTGVRPVDLWRQERAHLGSLAAVPPYRLWEHHERRVDASGLVQVQRSRYSVPPQYIGQTVVVALDGQRVAIRCGETIIAEHPRANAPGGCVTQPAHLEALAQQTLQRTPRATAPTLLPEVAVAVRPLSVYEEVGG